MNKYATIEKIANGFTVEFSGSNDSKPFEVGDTHYAPDLEGVYEKVKEFMGSDSSTKS